LRVCKYCGQVCTGVKLYIAYKPGASSEDSERVRILMVMILGFTQMAEVLPDN